MRLAFKKLFESGPNSAKTGEHSDIIQDVEGKTASTAEGDAYWQSQDEDSAWKYEKVSNNFDSIGQRNETLRAQLESIDFSFRDIDAIRKQFHDALVWIDQTLVEIERTKVANLEAERKLENLTAAYLVLMLASATQPDLQYYFLRAFAYCPRVRVVGIAAEQNVESQSVYFSPTLSGYWRP